MVGINSTWTNISVTNFIERNATQINLTSNYAFSFRLDFIVEMATTSKEGSRRPILTQGGSDNK